MHVPDGIISEPVCAAAAVVAATAFAGVWRAGRVHTSQRQLEAVGPTAALIFAGQMVNVAIGGGTSGHLIGAALAVAMVGPVAAMLAMALVLTIQALMFADGGVVALGVNLLLMAVIAPLVAATVMTLGRDLFGARAKSVPGKAANAALGAFASVMAAVAGYLVVHEAGATVAFSGRSIASAMVGTHVGVGILEAVLTAGVVLVVGAFRSAEPLFPTVSRRKMPDQAARRVAR